MGENHRGHRAFSRRHTAFLKRFPGVMSDGDELCRRLFPASGGGGRTAAPAAATAPGAAATPAVSFRAVDPEAPALA